MAEIVKKKTMQEPQRSPGRGVIESEVFDASRRARSIVQDADTKAHDIITQARAEATRILQEAQDQGYQMGESKGLKQYQESIVRMNHEYDELLGQAESQLLNLAVGVARKIIEKELMVNPRVVVDIVRRALTPMNRKRSIVLRINPADRTALTEHRPELLEHMLGGGNIVLMNDPNITRGGCIIETEHGTVDARLETQLSVINQILTGRREVVELNIEESHHHVEEPIQEESRHEEISAEAQSELDEILDEQADLAVTEEPQGDAWTTPEESAVHQVASQPVSYEEEVEAALEAVAPEVSAPETLMKEMEALSQEISSEEDLNELINSLDAFLDKGHE